MKTKLEWKEVSGTGTTKIGDPLFKASVHDSGAECDSGKRFAVSAGSPFGDWEILNDCESLEAAQLEVERRIREAARPLFADVIAERDAALARVAMLEQAHDSLAMTANRIKVQRDEALARVAELESHIGKDGLDLVRAVNGLEAAKLEAEASARIAQENEHDLLAARDALRERVAELEEAICRIAELSGTERLSMFSALGASIALGALLLKKPHITSKTTTEAAANEKGQNDE